jgi:hypothetical protein
VIPVARSLALLAWGCRVGKFLPKHGNIERTVKKMDENDACQYLKQFTKDVTQLATDIEQARRQQARKP